MARENSNDSQWDLKLNISTGGVDYSAEDLRNYGYDPTPYVVLERMVGLNIIGNDDVLVDYGCGKGRVSFFINSQTGCMTIGIDHAQNLIRKANENLEAYGGSEDVVFIYRKAEEYCPDGANRFYFFNPFSTGVFRDVLKRIEESYLKSPRDILIFFYSSTIEYKLYLPTDPRLELVRSVEFSNGEVDTDMPARLEVFAFRPLSDL